MSDLPDNQSKTLLTGFINALKDEADEIGDRQTRMSEICAEGKSAGFDPTKLREVVRWLRQVEKHGREKVDDAEAIFDMYRSVVEAPSGKIEDMMSEARDKALLKLFAPDDQVEAKLSVRAKKVREGLALSRAARVWSEGAGS